MYPRQHDLFISVFHDRSRFFDSLGHLFRAYSPSRIRDYAIRTEIVAAVLYLYLRAGALPAFGLHRLEFIFVSHAFNGDHTASAHQELVDKPRNASLEFASNDNVRLRKFFDIFRLRKASDNDRHRFGRDFLRASHHLS